VTSKTNCNRWIICPSCGESSRYGSICCYNCGYKFVDQPFINTKKWVVNDNRLDTQDLDIIDIRNSMAKVQRDINKLKNRRVIVQRKSDRLTTILIIIILILLPVAVYIHTITFLSQI